MSKEDCFCKCHKYISKHCGTCKYDWCKPTQEKRIKMTCASIDCPERTGGECDAVSVTPDDRISKLQVQVEAMTTWMEVTKGVLIVLEQRVSRLNKILISSRPQEPKKQRRVSTKTCECGEVLCAQNFISTGQKEGDE